MTQCLGLGRAGPDRTEPGRVGGLSSSRAAHKDAPSPGVFVTLATQHQTGRRRPFGPRAYIISRQSACQAIAVGESTTGTPTQQLPERGHDSKQISFSVPARHSADVPGVRTVCPRERELIRDKKRRRPRPPAISLLPFLSARCQSKENKAHKGIVGVMKGN